MEPLSSNNPDSLLKQLQQLRATVLEEGHKTYQSWQNSITREIFQSSAQNLACYLALRRQDLRSLQLALMPWGLSSLGRIESRVIPNLDAVTFTLAQICNQVPPTKTRPSLDAFFAGDGLLQQNTEKIFGRLTHARRVRIMVTLPSQAASDPQLVSQLVAQGTDCFRINCAHDNLDIWAQMIANLRQAERETGCHCRIFMDLAGPKLRINQVCSLNSHMRVHPGDLLLLRESDPTQPHPDYWQASSSFPGVLSQLKVNHRVWIDDGHIGGVVERVNSQGVWIKINRTRPKGEKLRPDKGLNFPDTNIDLDPLTPKDLQDLDFVASHADLIGYSFVQKASDIEKLQTELEKRLGNQWRDTGIIAKIETHTAIKNLPEIIVQTAGKQPLGIMIARGDLAVEIGYQRLAEMQEEILWLCQAAHVPVIWATQVLENLVKKSIPSRAEITDAAMAERAECVMLNKGPFIAEAVAILDDVLTRMEAHQCKKTPQLRALQSW